MQWILYGTLGCHLCEDAKSLLDNSVIAGQFSEEDIALDDALMERYGIRIPVLRCVASGEELGWPFDTAGLAAFIRGQS